MEVRDSTPHRCRICGVNHYAIVAMRSREGQNECREGIGDDEETLIIVIISLAVPNLIFIGPKRNSPR